LDRRTRRYIFFFAVILVGLAIGVIYGWVINPVKYRNTGMATLRMDYKTDYVLMVAELYESEGDVAMALARLSYLEAESPLALITSTIDFAENYNYTAEDLQSMWDLASAIDDTLKSVE
jgi:hypothetical protein